MHAQTEITTYWSDCDPLGHVNNAVYFTYMEQGRVALFKNIFKIPAGKPVEAIHFPFILAEITCRFIKPTYPDNILIVKTKVTELKNSSFFIEYEMINKTTKEIVATGKSVQVWYDYKLGKPSPIPNSFRKIFSSQSYPSSGDDTE